LLVWAVPPEFRPTVYDVTCGIPKIEYKDVKIRAWSGPMTLVTSDGRVIYLANASQCIIERNPDADKNH